VSISEIKFKMKKPKQFIIEGVINQLLKYQ